MSGGGKCCITISCGGTGVVNRSAEAQRIRSNEGANAHENIVCFFMEKIYSLWNLVAVFPSNKSSCGVFSFIKIAARKRRLKSSGTDTEHSAGM
jgi:hypothetical protein